MSSTVEAFGRRWERVWVEDECTRSGPASEGHEYVEDAWERLFGEEYPGRVARVSEEDWGDATAYLFSGRMEVASVGGSSIYVLVGATRTCPKCQRTSGDDWSQCNRACPMQESPRYQPPGTSDATPLRCSCDAFAEGPCPVHPCVCPERPCPACAPSTQRSP